MEEGGGREEWSVYEKGGVWRNSLSPAKSQIKYKKSPTILVVISYCPL
jgi:hypothetical protein